MKNKIIIWVIGGISAFVIFTLVVFAAFAFLFSYSMKRSIELEKKQTAETVGTITDYSETVDTTSSPPSVNYTLSYEYVVNGKSYYDKSYSPSSQYRKGKKGKVCYEPSNPENSSFHLDENRICGQ